MENKENSNTNNNETNQDVSQTHKLSSLEANFRIYCHSQAKQSVSEWEREYANTTTKLTQRKKNTKKNTTNKLIPTK